MDKDIILKKELKGFNINIDDIEPNEITHGAMQELIENIIIEENVKRFEIILNKNILNIKDRFTDIHSYMGLKLSLEPLEKDISFIIRPTNELTYDELQQENKQLKEKIKALELNWKIIKQYCLDEKIPEEYDEYNSYIEFSNSVYDDIFNKMENLELEQGSDK